MEGGRGEGAVEGTWCHFSEPIWKIDSRFLPVKRRVKVTAASEITAQLQRSNGRNDSLEKRFRSSTERAVSAWDVTCVATERAVSARHVACVATERAVSARDVACVDTDHAAP